MRSARRLLWLAIQVVAGGLGLMYLVTGYTFITTPRIEFIHYTGVSSREIWTVRNLGVRVLAIGDGLVVALLLRRRDLLPLMLMVRFISDLGDFANSAMTNGLDPTVPGMPALFCSIEATSSGELLWLLQRGARTSASCGDHKEIP